VRYLLPEIEGRHSDASAAARDKRINTGYIIAGNGTADVLAKKQKKKRNKKKKAQRVK
jgi:CelD/BcsL family acetyltransferase involved in cellulose biosynthesis